MASDAESTERAPAAGGTQRLARSGVIAVGAACLALGVAVGWGLSHILAPVRPAPVEDVLPRVCATDPDVAVRAWTHIVLHHSGTEGADAASIDRYHRRVKHWKNGLGYDFVIGNGSRGGDGEIETSRRWRRQLDGAHCRAGEMNRKAIGICFVGNFDIGPGPTEPQVLAGIRLIRHLARQFSIPADRVLGHGGVPGASTQCPGRRFPIELMRAAARDVASAE